MSAAVEATHVFLMTRVYGSKHGGSVYTEGILKALIGEGHEVTVVAGRIEGSERLLSHKNVETLKLRWFFQSGLSGMLLRMCDAFRLWRKLVASRKSILIVQGDLPRLTYILLQVSLPVVFIQQDEILSCPANRRYLPRSGLICAKPLGFSCLAVNAKEGCMSSMSVVHRLGRIVYRLRDRVLLRYIKNLVVNSRYIERTLGREAYVLYPARFDEQQVITRQKRTLTKLVFCGRLDTPVKGADHALRILAILPPDFTLDILGDGAGEPELKRLVMELGLQGRVAFHGWVNAKKRDQMFGAAGLLLIPSLWGEAFGMIGVEAFAQGTPVVGYNVGGIEEWCRCGAGILVSCGDIKAAAVAIQSIASDYAKWSNYSSCAKRIGETEFRESDFRKSLLTLLQPMLE